MTIRIGITSYLNAYPFYEGLREALSEFSPDFIESSPANLNELIRAGKIHISLVSSLEYARAPKEYWVLPGLSISARESSGSVGLIRKGGMKDWAAGGPIYFLRASASSVALLDILLKERFEVKGVQFAPVEAIRAEEIARSGGPVLVIGDQAMSLRRNLSGASHFIDLGTLWWEWMKKPFCFALWVVRRDYYEANPESVKRVRSVLKERVARNLAELPHEIKDYMLNFDYGLDADILQGLFLFYERAAKLGWSERVSDLEFAR